MVLWEWTALAVVKFTGQSVEGVNKELRVVRKESVAVFACVWLFYFFILILLDCSDCLVFSSVANDCPCVGGEEVGFHIRGRFCMGNDCLLYTSRCV